MSLVSNIASVVTAIGTQLKTLQGKFPVSVANGGTGATTVAGALTALGAPSITGATAIAVVSALPAVPDANTVYLITED